MGFSFGKTEDMIPLMAERAGTVAGLDAAVPMKTTAVHYCYDDARLRLFVQIVITALITSTKLRMRMHYGKDYTTAAICDISACNPSS